MKLFYALALLIINQINCDIYLQNPRGSNNRLNEQSNERNNEQRLFNSQNNNRGGYNVGNLYYYVNSLLQIEWTNQHSCANPNINCVIIIQYMCSDNLRDGATTNQIPSNNANCNLNNCSNDYRYGMQEGYDYYQTCLNRQRNLGLFTADQKLRGQTARFTRQNPNGDLYGTECNEERDYYPYWAPTPWIDIAILTDDVNQCDYYQNQSENVLGRWYCSVPSGYTKIIPNNKDDCEALTYNQTNGTWIQSPPNGYGKPICQETEYTRDNHLGNTLNGNTPTFNWTIPNNVNENCALRIRYNITTDDYNTNSVVSTNKVNLNYNNFNLNTTEATRRGYVFKNNPQLQIFPDIPFKLNLAVNTAQYGRVFQDRSHKFAIRSTPSNIDTNTAVIRNLNVRGKRGNIVQVYPGTEYDFVPNKLYISNGDYVHIQWTGSNLNPLGNDGNGVLGSDRNNIVLLGYRDFTKGAESTNNSYGSFGVNYPPVNIKTQPFLGLSNENLTNLAFSIHKYGGASYQLDDTSTYFDLNAQKVSNSGIWYYMCTRNNDFSNRDQKGSIFVLPYSFHTDSVGKRGGVIQFSDAVLSIPENTLNTLTYFTLGSYTQDELNKNFQSILNENSLASKYVVINNADNTQMSKPVNLSVKLNDNYKQTDAIHIYSVNPNSWLMSKLDTQVTDKFASVAVQQNGIYVAKYEPSNNLTLIISLCVGFIVVSIIILSIVIYLVKNPKYCKLMNNSASNAKRSLQNKI